MNNEMFNWFERFVRKSDLPYENWEIAENGFEVYVSESDAEELGLNTTEFYSFEEVEALMRGK